MTDPESCITAVRNQQTYQLSIPTGRVLRTRQYHQTSISRRHLSGTRLLGRPWCDTLRPSSLTRRRLSGRSRRTLGDPSQLAPERRHPPITRDRTRRFLEDTLHKLNKRGTLYSVRLLMSWCALRRRLHQTPKTKHQPQTGHVGCIPSASIRPGEFSYDRASLQLTSMKLWVYVTCDRALHAQEM